MTTFEFNPRGIAQLLSETLATAHLKKVGNELAREWERNDPRQKPGGHAPPKIEVGQVERNVDGTPVLKVFTNDPIVHIIEFGSANNPPYRPATNAADSVGVKLEGRR